MRYGWHNHFITDQVAHPRASGSVANHDPPDLVPEIKGIEYLSKLELRAVTSLENFRAEFRTKGDLRIATFSSPSPVAPVADARRQGRRYLFTNKKTKKHYTTIKTAWNTACELAGLVDLHFHDLCATFGTRAAAGGATLGDLQEVMGHAQITTTMQYVHATDAGKRRAVAAVQGPPAKVLKIRKA